jgi:hypothetical protein
MAATIAVVQNYGWASASYFGEVAKNISNLISIDDGIVDKLDYPVRIPNTGTTYSFETWIRCRCDVAPANFCNNFKAWYVSGMPTPGFTIKVNSTVVNTYQQPVDTESAQGTRVSFTDYIAENDSISMDGELVNIGDYTSWLVFQLEVINTASIGEYAIDYIIQYDEA